MNTISRITVLCAATQFFCGCATPQTSKQANAEREIRRELVESRPIKEYGYTIKEVRLSEDRKKALVIFTHPKKPNSVDYRTARPDWEFVLVADEFGRYRGTSMQPFYTPGTANTPPITISASIPGK